MPVVAIMLLALWVCSGISRAGDLFVDGKNPKADDTNPGTLEAPFKTIQAAVNKAVSGDAVLVKAGLYRETVTFKASGLYRDGLCQPVWPYEPIPERITLSALADDRVVLDGSDVVEAKSWQPLAGHANVYVAAMNAPRISLVYWNDRRLNMCLMRGDKDIAPAQPRAEDADTWYFNEKARRLYVNLGGADPSKVGKVEASVRPQGIILASHHHITIRRITVRRCSGTGIYAGASLNPIIEDCHVHDCETGIDVSAEDRPVVRRCIMNDLDGPGIDAGRSRSATVSDNVVYAFFQDWAKTGNIYKGAGYIHFGAQYARFFQNIVLQPASHQNESNRGGGFWPDCHSPGHFYVGNAARRCAIGFYIEAPAVGNVIQWNTTFKNNGGIWLRQNWMNVVAENFCEENGMGLVLASADQDIPDVAHNTFSHNWLKGNRAGISVGPDPSSKTQNRNYAQRNVYEIPADGFAANWANKNYKTLKDLRDAAGQETLGTEARINQDELDLAYVRVDDMDTSHEQIPLFANPSCGRMDTWRDFAPYWWRCGDAEGTDSYWNEWGNAAFYKLPLEQFPYRNMEGSSLGRSATPGAVVIWTKQAPVSGTPVGGWYLFAGSMPGKGFGPLGCGWWSPSLPVVGGATLDLALWMKIENIKPQDKHGGAVIYVEWSNWTGQNKTRSYLVGSEGGAKPANPEFNVGSKGWALVNGSLEAPKDARRFSLFMGGRNCTGTVSFDEIRTLSVRPGEPPKSAALAKPESKPLMDPNTLEFAVIDLSKLVNRSLGDEQADDGKGGWSDQGSSADMKGFPTGKKMNEGVPFEILSPLSCIVLDSPARPQSKLPKSVVIPMDRKADALFFLHSGAYLEAGKLHWTYRILYADGKSEEIKMVAGANIRDWSQANLTDFENTKTTRTTVWPDKVGNVLSPTCGVYRLEWLNPRPKEAIKSVEMISAGRGVPILLAVTAGAKKN
jgi:hypothetical protein